MTLSVPFRENIRILMFNVPSFYYKYICEIFIHTTFYPIFPPHTKAHNFI